MSYRPQRWPCRAPVLLHVAEGPVSAMMINISQHGARVAGLPPDTIAPAARLQVIAAGQRLAASVVWTRGDCAGLRFAAPLPKPVLQRLRVAGGAAAPGAITAPAAFAPAPATPTVRAAVRDLTRAAPADAQGDSRTRQSGLPSPP